MPRFDNVMFNMLDTSILFLICDSKLPKININKVAFDLNGARSKARLVIEDCR